MKTARPWRSSLRRCDREVFDSRLRRLRIEPLEDRRLLSVGSADEAMELFRISPALFVENQGQWADESVRYLHQGDGASVAMTDTGPVFQLTRRAEDSPLPLGEGQGVRAELLDTRFDDGAQIAPYETLRFSASFPNANPVRPTGL